MAVVLMGACGVQAQSSQLSFWNFNNYDPATETSASADGGTQAGVAVFDWSSFGTGNVISPAIAGSVLNGGSSEAGNGLGLLNPVTPTSRFIEVTADLTGFDVPILYFAGSRGGSSLSGEWSFSINGGTSFTSVGNRFLPVGDFGQSAVILSPAALRNQSNVVFRYTFSGTNQPVGFDNFEVTAREAKGIVGYAVNGVRSARAIAGRTTDLDFAISERTGTNQQYSLAGTNLNIFSPTTGTLFGGSGTVVDAQADLTNAAAGDLVTSVLEITNTATSEISTAAVALQAVGNREMSSTNGNLGNIGRIVRGVDFAAPLTISGGAATDAEATRITLRDGVFATNGMLFTSAGNVFDSANETADLQVAFSNSSPLGERTINLAGLNPFRQGSFSGQRLFAGENLQGEALNVSGVTLNVTATVLANRSITGQIIDLGREMAGSGNGTLTGSVSATIVGDSRTDLQATRVGMAGGTVGSIPADGVSVTVEAKDFNAADVTASATVAYDFEYDRSVTGATIRSVNVAGLLSDAELASAGATVDDSVVVGVKKTVVADRQVLSHTPNNISILENSIGVDITRSWFTTGDDSEFTRVTVNGVVFNNADGFTSVTESISVGGPTSGYSTVATFAAATITGEGLAGENVATDSASTTAARVIQRASAGVSLGSGSTLRVGDELTVSNAAASAGFYRSGVAVDRQIIGNSGFRLSGLSSVIEAGSSSIGTVEFLGSGRLNGTHSANLILNLTNSDGYGAVYGDVGTYSYQLSHTVTGASGLGGSATVRSGDTLKTAGLGLTFSASSFSVPTAVDFLDSATLTDDTSFEIAFVNAGSAPGGAGANLVSDMVSLEGLDGILFVLQVKYDPQAVLLSFGSEEFAQINWYDETYETWVNAILGNSDGGAGGQRFLSSYDDYLTTVGGTPVLSHFGVDTVNKSVWAVLDHNSSFAASGPTAAVPEPSVGAMFVCAAAGLAALRRRRRS